MKESRTNATRPWIDASTIREQEWAAAEDRDHSSR